MFFPFPYITAEHAQLLARANGIAHTAVSGTGSETDAAYNTWMDYVARCGYAPLPGSYSPPATRFWLVLQLPKENFSENIEFHDKLPMMIPTKDSSTLLGVASTQEEAKEMCEEHSKKFVHLTYKISVRNEEDWRALLDMAGERGMIEKEA